MMTASFKLGNGKVVFVAFVQIVGHQFSSIVSLTQLIKIYNFQKPKQTIFIKNVVFQTHNLCTKPNRVYFAGLCSCCRPLAKQSEMDKFMERQ